MAARLCLGGGAGLIVLVVLAMVACAPEVQPTGPSGESAGGAGTTTTFPDTPATTLPGTPALPNQVVAVGDDGALVVVDTRTGERLTELARSGRPGRSRPFIAGVSVSANGDTAWFDTRTRYGGAGRIYQVPTDGPAPPTQVASGTFPEVDPAGVRLAFVGDGAVVVHGIVTDEEERWPVTGRVTDLMWSEDGNDLLWVRNGTELVWLDRAGGAEPQVIATAGAGEILGLPLGPTQPSLLVNVQVGTGFHDPTPERLLVFSLDEPPNRSADSLGRALDRSCNASAQWCVRVTGSHTIRWSGSGGVGTIATGYRAADW